MYEPIKKLGGGLKYKLLKESTANQTYASQLAELESTFTGLTPDQARRCILSIGNDIYTIQQIASGDFYMFYQNASHVVVGIFLSIRNKTNYQGSLSGTLTDKSSITNSSKICLYMLTDSD